MIMCRSILLRRRGVPDKDCRRNQNTYFSIFFLEKLIVYEIMWKNMVELDRPQMTI
jgi:hypothetical protein